MKIVCYTKPMKDKYFAAIVTAVEVEEKSVHYMYDWEPVSVPGSSDTFFETTLERDGKPLHLVTARQRRMGVAASCVLTGNIIHYFKPDYVIMCGIAAGTGENEGQIYGDVLVPDMVWDYSSGKFVSPAEGEISFGDIGFIPRPSTIEADKDLLKIVENTRHLPDNEYHIHIGHMACGSSVVANRKLVDQQVTSLFPGTVGLDMESYGVLYAAAHAPAPKPKALVVKSICDFANAEKADDFQRFAAYTSSGYLRYLLENKLPLL